MSRGLLPVLVGVVGVVGVPGSSSQDLGEPKGEASEAELYVLIVPCRGLVWTALTLLYRQREAHASEGHVVRIVTQLRQQRMLNYVSVIWRDTAQSDGCSGFPQADARARGVCGPARGILFKVHFL